MNSGTCRYLILFFLVVVQFGENQCWRSSKPSSPSRRPTSSPYRPFPTHAPTHRPFPTHAPTYRPAPTRAPTYRPFPTHAPTYKPFPTHAPTYKPFPTHAPTYKPYPTSAPTYRPYPTHAPTYKPYPTSAPTYRPYPTHAPTYRPATVHYPTSRPTAKYPTQRYPTGPHPTYPGLSNGGVSPPKNNAPTYAVPIRVPGTNKVKVYNINNYHSPGYYAPPSYPTYHYTYRDTGDTTLGLYLGYRLGQISHPTYYHQDYRFYDGYNPRYDHYTVHHYYHNSGSIPSQQTITTKVIIQCGDSNQICPANTTSLCTANGQIMCVVVASDTMPCENNPSLRCVKSSIPCENNQTAECKGVEKGQTATISIPCISNTRIEGNVTIKNNTIVAEKPVLAKNALKSIVALESPSVTTSTERTTTVTILANTTTTVITPTSAITPTNTTKTVETLNTMSTEATPAITTMGSIETTTLNGTFESLGARTKREAAPLQYCVTVVAEPSKRAPTEGEEVFKEITSIFDKFFTKAFGMDKVQKPAQNNKYEVPDLGD